MLVTGAGGGLGGALHARLGGTAGHRDNLDALLGGASWDTVVHCAHSRRKDLTERDLSAYLDDTLLLTERALARCTRRFVLASSISVYPPGPTPARGEISVDRVSGAYGMVKLMAESRARAWADRTGGQLLILRLGSLLGWRSPPNVTARILRGECDSVPLTGNSRFNYVSHAEVADFTSLALEESWTGTFDLGASRLLSLAEVAERAGRRVRFGSIEYRAPLPDNAPVAERVPSFAKDPLLRIDAAIEEQRGGHLCGFSCAQSAR